MPADRLLEWKASLLTQYVPASVAGYVKAAKMAFDWAVEQGIEFFVKEITNGKGFGLHYSTSL